MVRERSASVQQPPNIEEVLHGAISPGDVRAFLSDAICVLDFAVTIVGMCDIIYYSVIIHKAYPLENEFLTNNI